jgi:hypothetical protein
MNYIMKEKYFIFSLLIICVGFACKNEDLKFYTKKNYANDSAYHCILTDSLSKRISELEDDSEKFNKNYSHMDICFLAFIDSLYNHVVVESSSKYLSYINLIASESDGYVSEYLDIITVKLFINKSKLLISYFYDNRLASNKPLENFFIEFLKKELTDSKDRKNTINLFKEKVVTDGYNFNERKYFNKLIDSAQVRLKE